MTPDDEIARALELLNPAQLWLRFYGRFLFVYSDDDLIVLAVNACGAETSTQSGGTPTRSQSAKAHENGKHRLFLTIREMNAMCPSIEPTSRLVGTEVAPFQGALNVWDIDGYSIDVPGKSGAKWPSDKRIPLADLNVLAPGYKVNSNLLKRNQPLHPYFLGVIRVPAGSDFSYHLPTKDFGAKWEFIASDDSTVFGAPDDPLREPLADMVQITMDLTDGAVDLKLEPLPADTVATSPPSGSITVMPFTGPKVDPIVVVSFSNLCSTPAPIGGADDPYVDREFGSFYNVFLDPPKRRYLPRLTAAGFSVGELERRRREALANGCVESFRPMGDCFLGAMVRL